MKTTAGGQDQDIEKTEQTWFQRFGLFFYDRRETTFLFWIVLIIFGLLSYTVLLKRQGFPNVSVPISIINGQYFVNDKTKVDAEVAKPVVDIIKQLAEVKTITSSAGDNFFNMMIEYKEGTTSATGNELIKKTISQNQTLPKQAQLEFQAINPAQFEGQSDLLVSAYSPTINNQEVLEQKAGSLAKILAKTEGVADAKIIKLYETGVNPQTGQQVIEQRRFDRIGIGQTGDLRVYPAVTIGVRAAAGTDAIHLYRNVQKATSYLSNKPETGDLALTISADFAEGITTQVDSLQENLLAGLIVVLLVSLLLISWRASIVAAISMISVILVTVAILYATGNTLNTITLFALILSLGLIVDDTIIMTEAIDAGKHSSTSRREILGLAMKRVARASTTGTLTTILAFAPMLFISGILGSFIRVLPITIIISLVVSLLMSLILVPLLSRYILLRKKPVDRSKNPVLQLEKLLSRSIARLIRVGNRSRAKLATIAVVVLLFSLIMILSSGFFFQKLKFDIFPSVKDSDAMIVGLRFAPGTNIDQAQAVADKANQIVIDNVGKNLRRLSYQSSGSATQAMINLDLVSYKDRDVTSPELVANLQSAFTSFEGAVVKVSQVDVGPPREDLPFRVQLYNEDLKQAQPLAQAMVEFLKGRQVKRPNDTTAQITRAEIANPAFVTRQNGAALVEVQAGFDATDTSALVGAAQKAVEDEFTPEKLATFGFSKEDVKFDFGFESSNQESFRSMLIAFPILLVTMYVLMLIQFRSLLQPLLIFAAIPFSFFGVAAGLYATNNPLSFFVMIGFFALIGIALNNTILLTDYANQAKKQGLSRIDAMASAVEARFRPLITTSLTSVVALTPLALSDPFWESLSFTLIFGLLSSTFLVILAFPYLYLAGEALRILGQKMWQRIHKPQVSAG